MTVPIKKRLSLLLALLVLGPAIAIAPVWPSNSVTSRLSISLQLNIFTGGQAIVGPKPSRGRAQGSPTSRGGGSVGAVPNLYRRQEEQR